MHGKPSSVAVAPAKMGTTIVIDWAEDSNGKNTAFQIGLAAEDCFLRIYPAESPIGAERNNC